MAKINSKKFISEAPFPLIPVFILEIGEKLIKNNFQAYLVGGGVRDVILGRMVKDWDITTDASPKEIMEIFPESFYNNTFGTVGVKVGSKEDKKEKIVEITTFRKEEKYLDFRHPQKVVFAKTIEEDLLRRDFTINALAINLNNFKEKNNKISSVKFQGLLSNIKREEEAIAFEETLSENLVNRGPGIFGEEKNLLQMKEIPQLGFGSYPKFYINKIKIKESNLQNAILDLFQGKSDLENRLIRTCGNPQARFKEDALRLLRAVRFSVELGFKIEKETASAIKKNSTLIRKISQERIRDEFIKIIKSPWPAEGIILLHELGLLKEIIPELEEGFGIEQGRHHIYSVFWHAVFSLKFCFSGELEILLASLFHDVAKPRVKRGVLGKQATFYFHEVEGERITRRVLERLCFPSRVIDEVALLVRHHMFNFDANVHNESTVRRLLHRVGGIERMKKLLIIRIADRLGSGCKKGEVFKLRKLKYYIDKVSTDPVSLKQLAVNGKDLMDFLKIQPGPVIGDILEVLLAQIISSPKKNKKKLLLEMASELWAKEKTKPGLLKEKCSEAKKFLEGKKEDYDLSLKIKHKVRERK